MASGTFGTSEKNRLGSLDAFRGMVMILLVARGFGLNQITGLEWLAKQFTHHPGHGLWFWDLVQPFFMYIAGVAMPFSFYRRWEKGEAWSVSLVHVIRRSFILLILGILIHCAYQKKWDFELMNVLSQLAFTYFITFLLLKRKISTQLIVSLLILVAYYLAFLLFTGSADNSPWALNKNLGSAVDRLILGKTSLDGWITINFIGSAPHTIWGGSDGLVTDSKKICW